MKATFNITYYSKKEGGYITRKGMTNEMTREGVNKKTKEPYFVYYDLDKLGYRTATKEWRIKEIA